MMTSFTDVSLPAVIFVIVNFIVAVIGNTLVLIVFGWRWHTTNDTKIYIMVLAAFDLACTLVSSPRDVISLFPDPPCMLTKPAMLVYCRLSFFLTGHLNLASAFVLLSIAASRYVKVTKADPDNMEDPDPGICHALKTLVKRLARTAGTVRGAKTASAVSFCVAFIVCSPSLVIYGSGDGFTLLFSNISEKSTLSPHNNSETSTLLPHNNSETSTLLPHNNSETSTLLPPNVSEAGPDGTVKDIACPMSSRYLVHSDYKIWRKVYQMYTFIVIASLFILLFGIYNAILLKLCCRKNRTSDSTRRDSVMSCPDQNLDALELSQQKTDGGNPGNPTATGVITSDTVAADGESTGPASPSSTKCLMLNNSRPAHEDDRTPMAQLSAQTDHVQYRKNNSQSLTFFPRLSSRSDHGSALSLSGQMSQTRSVTRFTDRLSTASFQLTMTGNRARLTTLVFLMVTFIYILSYCPFFCVVLYERAAGLEVERPWRHWETATHAFALICARSYLIGNAANPLVYGLGNPYFRSQLGKLLTCRRDVI
ncbi:uncharacterized protein LOC143291088 [Babylonia areolata]|uniref:uncharacterized protein LOC143291088 n=1 Tax=Babylonia areolata TaxID=304850 RepID=UPI003FD28C84